MTSPEVARRILEGRGGRAPKEAARFAPANIALGKYWGKRDESLNLPVTSSLSVSLGDLGTHTTVRPADHDEILLAGEPVDPRRPFAGRIREFLGLLRGGPYPGFRIETRNTIPTAAGLASSASGFAALVLALDEALDWRLEPREASILARLGSGSACRSVYRGFVEWKAGTAADGMDSYAEPMDAPWPSLRVGIVTVSAAEKPMGSRPAMRQTVETSALYHAWPAKVQADLEMIRAAIRGQDLGALGRTAESNALAMHGTMLAAQPPVLYWLPGSVRAIQRVWAARADGVPLYFTMDAGPNLKLLFQEADTAHVAERFPETRVVAPFSG